MPSIIDQHLSAKIVEARENLGLSISDVAGAIGLSAMALTEIESGKVRISAFSIAQLSRALNVSPRWFYFGLPGQDAFDQVG